MSEAKQYSGSCHCGNVTFKVNVSLDKIIECNCSICSKRGHLLSFTPGKNFELLTGKNCLIEYRFGKKRIGHLFCARCGIAPFAVGGTPDGKEMRAINVRCLDGVDISTLKTTHYDGKSI